MNKGIIESIKESAKDIIEEQIESKIFVPSSSILLNLACANREKGAFRLGRFINIIGESQSGKSFLSISLLAECARDHRFDNHELIYDDAESACSFDLEHLFGEKTVSRIQMEEPSDKVEDFFNTLRKKLKTEKPFIYVLDSYDALSTDKEEAKTDATFDARDKGKKVTGDYGMQKAKISSQLFRMIKGKLNNTNSLLIIISQTRANIDPMSFSKVTRSGGKALDFYASTIMWMNVRKKLMKTVMDNEHQVGVKTLIKISKCRETGRPTKIPMTINFYYGIDDITDSVEFLVDNKVFKMITKQKFEAPQFEFKGVAKTLVRYIEEHNMEDKLKKLVADTWFEIVEGLKCKDRKPKFRGE